MFHFSPFVHDCIENLALMNVFVAGACVYPLFLPNLYVFRSVCTGTQVCLCVCLRSASFPLCLLVNFGIWRERHCAFPMAPLLLAEN